MGLDYVKYIKNALVKSIKAGKENINKNNNPKKPGQECKLNYEETFTETWAQVDPLLESVKGDGSLAQERQNVRMLQIVGNKMANYIAFTNYKPCNWKRGSVCDPKTSKCTAYDKTLDPTEKPGKRNNSGTANSSIISIGIVTILVLLYNSSF